ncbi:M23 family metallopeptidase [Geofilum sp. OHC36d9]|uniref:M23 family metallopeptidase n=1 Tax=Geofilum sp. OHC36d9 TaxID=3458413 RepID=UPI00403486C0
MIYKYIFALALLGHFLLAESQSYPQWNFRFPLDIDAVVSGSFGELRSNHFHSGVDLTTNGETGLPVYCVDEGYVSRIVVSPVGFGKALYIDHPNGYTSVYAHLNGFNGVIEKKVIDLAYQKQSFALDVSFEPGEMTVSKGEMIAYSGNSGSSGGPHLHFEIRETAQQKPVNVLKFNFPVEDKKAPHIQSVCIYPLDDVASVNGKQKPLRIPAVFYNGAFHLRGNPKIEASGTIGVGIETFDYYSNSWRKCGVYAITLREDGNVIFRSQLDGFLFRDTRYINSHIDYARKQMTGVTIQKSFLDLNNRLNIYNTDENRGRIKTIAGVKQQLNYTVEDAAGNQSELSFTVIGSKRKILTKSRALELIDPLKPYSFQKDGFSITIPANTFYEPIVSDFEVIDADSMYPRIKVLDAKIPFQNYVEVALPVPSACQNVKGLTGVSVNNSGRMTYAGGTLSNGTMVIRTRVGGTYGLAVDSLPPTIAPVKFPIGNNFRSRKAIEIRLDDDFSGINEYSCTIDGAWALFEYDPKSKSLKGYFKYLRITKGEKHNLTVEASDRTGNVSKWQTSFVY